MAIFDTLQNPHPLTDHQKFGTSDYWLRPRPLRLCQIWCKSACGGLSAFGANGWNIMDMFFINTFLRNHVQFRPVDGFSRLMAQTTRTRARVCLLTMIWQCLWMLFGLNSPKTPIFGAWIGVFKPNGQNIESFMLSKLLHRFQTNFCTTIETTKWSPWVVRIGANKSKIADGRHFEKKR